jgi:hypothetical protein
MPAVNFLKTGGAGVVLVLLWGAVSKNSVLRQLFWDRKTVFSVFLPLKKRKTLTK